MFLDSGRETKYDYKPREGKTVQRDPQVSAGIKPWS